jgi:hypothetical protein
MSQTTNQSSYLDVFTVEYLCKFWGSGVKEYDFLRKLQVFHIESLFTGGTCNNCPFPQYHPPLYAGIRFYSITSQLMDLPGQQPAIAPSRVKSVYESLVAMC